jgi:hypothetical protein
MIDHTDPPPLFFKRARRVDSIEEAIAGAINHLQRGEFQKQAAAAFNGNFGPEPFVTFQITLRRDPKNPGAFSYRCNTNVRHDIGDGVSFYGLKP